MKEYILEENQNYDQMIKEISERLLNDEVGILPTETVFGLVCMYGSAEGLERIYEIKDREKTKKLQVLIASFQQLDWIQVDASNELQALANHFWPGPLTVIVENRIGKEVGIRIPDHFFVQSVIDSIGKPLIATSANRSNCLPEHSASDNFNDLKKQPDFICRSSANTEKSSTVIRLQDKHIELIREGKISQDSILAAVPTLKSCSAPKPAIH